MTNNSDVVTHQVTDPYIVGIDLGTTNSVISVIENKKPVTIPNDTGKKTIPSIVRIYKDKQAPAGFGSSVGEEAMQHLLSDPQNTIYGSKRLIGRKQQDPVISDYLQNLPYRTKSVCNGDVWVKTEHGKFSPAEIGSKILSKLKGTAEKYLGRPVTRAVITVPAYFDDAQRMATKEAGRMANLDVVRIINEPTAAALAYGLDKNKTGHVAVYDLGGGTFDISILELMDGVFHVKATNGDTFLGGEDFDSEIVSLFRSLHKQNEGEDILDAAGLQRLREAAEATKKNLSSKTSVRVFLPNITASNDFDQIITRQQIESVVKKVAIRTISACEAALKDARVKKQDIDAVILVGGMTRMPYIRELVKSIFGKEPFTDIDPDEAVANGAAIQAGILSGSLSDILLLDVAPLSLGIELLGGVFSRIVNRNTTIPFKHTEVFSTSEDNQNEVTIRVYQGEREMAADNRFLGELKLSGIPPAPRGIPKISVTFEGDVNGLISVSAVDEKSTKSIVAQLSAGVTKSAAAQAIIDANENKAQDAHKKKCSDLRLKCMELARDLRSRNLPLHIFKMIGDLEALARESTFDIDKVQKMYMEIKKLV